MNWIQRVSSLFLLLITILPLIPTGKWYVRWWDFPRLQIAVLLAIPIWLACVQIFESGFKWEPVSWLALAFAAMVWQVSHIIPFSPLWKTEVADSVKDRRTVEFMVANLDYQNKNRAEVLKELSDEHPDVLLLVESDKAWKQDLSSLREKYKYHHEELRGEGLGMAVWSQLPITKAETKHLVSDRRASLWTQIQTNSGETINFVGVHPTPPGLLDTTGETRRDSRVRDAELILVAKEIAAQRDEAWVVAGDFNDVAWSHTTRLFKRTSGLLDPRIGRTFMGTYMANYPPFRCPIDHVFVSEGFTLGKLARKRITGSDHFAVLAAVALAQPDAGVTPKIKGDDLKDAKKMIEEGKEDAADRAVRAD